MVRSVIEKGRVIFPQKFNLVFDPKLKDWVFSKESTFDYINYLKKNMGSDFYAQYENNPIDSESQLIKRDYFKYWDHRPEYLNVVITVDPALSFKQAGDYTAIVVCGMDPDRNIYVLDYLRGHWGDPSQIVHNLLAMIDKWKPMAVGIESMGFQRTLKYWIEQLTLTKRHVQPITELKAPPTQSKEFRLKALEPYYRNGMVYHAAWMKGKELEEELLMLGDDGYKGKHDDLFDALAHQLNLLLPASIDISHDIPVGSWAWEEKEARKSLTLPHRFFQE